jgi:poly(3-hydroxybutyrate) depolymerase
MTVRPFPIFRPCTIAAAASMLLVSSCGAQANHGPSLGDENLMPNGAPHADGGTAAEPSGGLVAPRVSAPVLEGQLSTLNSAARTGAFYLPAGYNQHPVALLVAYHGTGGRGADMVGAFRNLAASSPFAIVAPDSRVSPDGLWTWQVSDTPGDMTEDYTHTLDCIAELRAKPGVVIDAKRVLAAGYSGGGSSAPYIASNESLFRAYAVLHGGVIGGGIGRNVIPGWFSTGVADNLRPPDLVQQSVDYMKGLGFSDVTFRTYPGEHGLGGQEIADVVGWWLAQ